MNEGRIRGDWPACRDMVRRQWNHLTDEDLDAIDGERETLLNVLEQRYDSPRERLEQQVSEFEARLGSTDAPVQHAQHTYTGGSAAAEDGSQGRTLYEENDMARNPQQQGGSPRPDRNAGTQGDKGFAEQNAGAGSMGNKRGDEQNYSQQDRQGSQQSGSQQSGSQQNKQGSQQQGSQQYKQGAPDKSQQGSRQDSQSQSAGKQSGLEGSMDSRNKQGMGSSSTDLEEEDVGEVTDREASNSQADGSSRDKSQQSQQKNKQGGAPPSWQRQGERRPDQSSV